MASGTTNSAPGAANRHTVDLVGWLWIPAVLVRLVAVIVLVVGPWTDEPAELAGWDAERFQEIATRTEDGWREVPIEYPPGSVVVIDAVAGRTVVETNRTIVIVSAVAELAIVALLWIRIGSRAAKGFLVLGLPLIPMGLMRLDLVATGLATAAALVLVPALAQIGTPIGTRAGSDGARTGDDRAGRDPGRLRIAAFGLLIAAGAMVKLWPALVVFGAMAIGRWRAVVAAVTTIGVFGLTWLVMVDDGLGPVDQVLSLRGATGWHIESGPGALVALFGSAPPRLELNAFRIGTLNPGVVTAGRVGALLVFGLLTMAAIRSSHRGPDRAGCRQHEVDRFALVVLGSVAALLVTAPLLSPQFILWLTPWAAMVLARPATDDGSRRLLMATVVAIVVLTGGTLAVFGPPNLADTAPALLLTARNLALAAVPVLCLHQLVVMGRSARRSGARADL